MKQDQKLNDASGKSWYDFNKSTLAAMWFAFMFSATFILLSMCVSGNAHLQNSLHSMSSDLRRVEMKLEKLSRGLPPNNGRDSLFEARMVY